MIGEQMYIDEIDAFLKKTAEDYHGELIIISAHSGLHVLGMNPGSVDPNNRQLSEWIGENAYNIDQSYDLASLINSYAEKYDMNIMYLFGHDHSRQEKELILTRGDTLVSPENYTERSYGLLPLNFTYAHSGYLSTVIGCADANFSFIYRNEDNYSFDLIHLADNSVRHTDIESLYHPEETVTSTADTTSASSAASEATVSSSAAATIQTSTASTSTGAGSTSVTSSVLPETGVKTAVIPLSALLLSFGGIGLMKKSKKNK